jgi:hypothetical protein
MYRAITLKPDYRQALTPPVENARPLKRAPEPFRVLWYSARSLMAARLIVQCFHDFSIRSGLSRSSKFAGSP